MPERGAAAWGRALWHPAADHARCGFRRQQYRGGLDARIEEGAGPFPCDRAWIPLGTPYPIAAVRPPRLVAAGSPASTHWLDRRDQQNADDTPPTIPQYLRGTS